MKPLPEEVQTIMDRHVGRFMIRLEQLRMEPPELLSIVKDIVRKEMRFMAENIQEAHDAHS